MHSIQCVGDDGNETIFHFNSDLSGDVTIVRRQRPTDETTNEEMRVINDASVEIQVPGEHLLQFVAAHVVSERISELEDMDWREALGLHGHQ